MLAVGCSNRSITILNPAPPIPQVSRQNVIEGNCKNWYKLIQTQCIQCHKGASNRVNGVTFGDFNDEESFVQAGLIIPGKPYQSPLFKRLKGAGYPESDMPPTGELDPNQVNEFRDWIDQMDPNSYHLACGVIEREPRKIQVDLQMADSRFIAQKISQIYGVDLPTVDFSTHHLAFKKLIDMGSTRGDFGTKCDPYSLFFNDCIDWNNVSGLFDISQVSRDNRNPASTTKSSRQARIHRMLAELHHDFSALAFAYCQTQLIQGVACDPSVQTPSTHPGETQIKIMFDLFYPGSIPPQEVVDSLNHVVSRSQSLGLSAIESYGWVFYSIASTPAWQVL